MRPYADVPGRRALQILADVLAVTAIVVAVRVGRAVHDAIAAYSVWGERVESAGESLGSSLTSIGATLSQIPLVGTIIGDPFTGAVGAADELAALGDDIQERVSSFATTAGVLTAALPILAVLVGWLVPRLRFAVRAGRVRAVALSPAGRDLLALRALASAPIQDLQRLRPDVAAAWRAGDEAAIDALASLTLSQAGVRIPDRVTPAA